MVLVAILLVFIGITVAPLGPIGRWFAVALILIANVLLWGAMCIGFYLNVFLPWWNGDSDDGNAEQEQDEDGG